MALTGLQPYELVFTPVELVLRLLHHTYILSDLTLSGEKTGRGRKDDTKTQRLRYVLRLHILRLFT